MKKKLLFFVSALTLTLLLTACGAAETPAETPEIPAGIAKYRTPAKNLSAGVNIFPRRPI